jgi:hypothetical protein
MKTFTCQLASLFLLLPWADLPADELPSTTAVLPDAPAGKYLRVRRNVAGEPTALETAIVTFRSRSEPRSAVEVDLISAVHVADKQYYQRLNERFAQYDALLYELVAPEEARVPANGRTNHPVGAMQKGLKSILDLAFQLECIDYTRPNFVHADMSPAEFSRAMADRGESFLQILLRVMGQAMSRQALDSGPNDADLLLALFSSDRSLRLKRIMADQFENLEESMAAIEGPRGSALISERNKKALRVLQRYLRSNEKSQRIGIFYGAGHMPDLAARLTEDFDLVPVQEQWLTAWEMR